MKNIRLTIISAALLLLVFGSSTVYAEAIGRVLVAVGDTSALRNGEVVKLTRGAEVQTGDTLHVGEASNMQVRFTDESITALRSNSIFRIDDYQFEKKTNLGKSFFSLVKGGMRAITGLIGRYNRDNYAVKAVTATIGVRGTHFVLAQCASDCFNKDGSQAENGLFGGVTDGRITVTNQAGEQEFGKNEFFHVSSSDALPKPLLSPPSFLRDQLEGQAKSKKGKTTLARAADGGGAENGDKDSSSEDKEDAGTGAGSETSGTEQQADTSVTTQSTMGPPSTPDQVATNAQFTPTQQDVVQTDVSGGLINTALDGQSYSYSFAMVNAWAGIDNWSDAGGSGTGLYGYSDASLDQGVLTVLDSTKLLQAQDVLFADFVINQTPAITFLANAYSAGGISDYYHYTGANCNNNCQGTLAGTVNFSWTKSASTDMGSSVLAGNLSWGRYTHTYSKTVLTGIYAGNTSSETSYEHWATGDLPNVAALPTSGLYTYSHVGGTRPTDQNGNVGTIIGGAVGITFNSGGASVSLTGASWDMPTGNNYSLNFSNAAVTIEKQPYSVTTSGYTDAGITTYITPIATTATCTGACSTGGILVNTVVSPMLFGAAAQGLAVGIHTDTLGAVGTSPHEITASVQAYKTP
ncbi:MAG TPA: FecR domain-containing protein [Gallionella sp.]|jgi:hypothetical protein|nr:FecR domain-containing protein [Gallionella sp.]